MNSTNDREIVKFEGKDENEGIGHWITAKNLLVGDKCLLSDGNYGIIVNVNTEECEKFTTYNFEVEDYHTYYVGDEGVLVHNACRTAQRKKYWKNEANVKSGDGITYKATNKNISRMKAGKAPKGFDGNSVEIHHVKGIMNDFDDIVQIQKLDHIKYHQTYKYKNFIELITNIAEFADKIV